MKKLCGERDLKWQTSNGEQCLKSRMPSEQNPSASLPPMNDAVPHLKNFPNQNIAHRNSFCAVIETLNKPRRDSVEGQMFNAVNKFAGQGEREVRLIRFIC